jgi:nucleotide-binding universal stress UspA family protein
MPTVYRVIVGASGSPASLQALRYAQHLARDYDATLVPVLAWLPPCGDLADRRTPNEELRRLWAQDAGQRLQDALHLAWGTPPTDLPVQPLVPAWPPRPGSGPAAAAPSPGPPAAG